MKVLLGFYFRPLTPCCIPGIKKYFFLVKNKQTNKTKNNTPPKKIKKISDLSQRNMSTLLFANGYNPSPENVGVGRVQRTRAKGQEQQLLYNRKLDTWKEWSVN